MEDGGWKEMAGEAAPDAEELDGRAADGEGDESGGSGVPGADDAGELITPFEVFARASVVASVDAVAASVTRWLDIPDGPA